MRGVGAERHLHNLVVRLVLTFVKHAKMVFYVTYGGYVLLALIKKIYFVNQANLILGLGIKAFSVRKNGLIGLSFVSI